MTLGTVDAAGEASAIGQCFGAKRGQGMPAWDGGECPECGTYMPANLIHCQSCRARLNLDLAEIHVEIPDFVPLPELNMGSEPRGEFSPTEEDSPPALRSPAIGGREAARALPSTTDGPGDDADQGDMHSALIVPVLGVFVPCPHCAAELKVSRELIGQRVACRHCDAPFDLLPGDALPLRAAYADCGYCSKRLRLRLQYLNQVVSCNGCQGSLVIQDVLPAQPETIRRDEPIRQVGSDSDANVSPAGVT